MESSNASASSKPENIFVPFPDRGYISHSSTQLFGNCQQAWHYRYVEGVPSPPSRGQAEGKAWGAALEDNLPKVLEEIAIENIYQDIEYLEDVCTTYIDIYRDIYGSDEEREIEYELDLPGTDFKVRGIIDANQGQFLVEDKFLLPLFIPRRMADILCFSPQETQYLWAASQLGLPDTLQHRITCKPQIKRKQGEKRSEYRGRLAGKLVENQENVFRSYPAVRTQQQLDNHEDELRIHLARMLKGEVVRNRSHCGQYGGCPFIELCKDT